MPARRRFHGSESDDNFSVLIDTGVDYANQNEKNTKYIEGLNSEDDNKKNIAPRNFYSNFKVPGSLTKWSSTVGTFIQEQIVQASNVNVEQLFFENNPPNDKSPLIGNYTDSIDNDFDDIEDNSEITVMAARDRTGEFATTIRSLQGRNISRAVNIRDPRKATQLQSYGEFMMIAKHIGRNIASTYSKLEKLTLCEFY